MARRRGGTDGFLPTGGRAEAASTLRLVLGLVVVLIAILAVVAFLNSLLQEPRPGPVTNTQQGSQGTSGGGSGGRSCTSFVRFFLGAFVVLGALDLALFGLAIGRRGKHHGNVATSPWGIAATIDFFFVLLALGAWRLMDVLCHSQPNCQGLSNGAYTTFLFLLALTAVPFGLGIFWSHVKRKNFFATGWGILGVVLYLPTLLAGFFWYLVRLFCQPGLSCNARAQLLHTLAWTFWLGLAAAVVAFGLGIFVQREYKHGLWKSGWGILGVLCVLMAVFAGAGWKYVDGLYIPGCDPPRSDQPQEPPTCAKFRDDLQGKLGAAFLALVVGAVAGFVTAAVLRRPDWKRALSHWGAVAGYILLGLAIIVGLLWLLAGGLCGQGKGQDRGQGGQQGGSQGGGGGGQQGGGGGGQGGQGGGAGSGGGSGSNTGGGGGGTGTANPLVIQFNPQALTWLLVAVGALLALGVLVYLLRRRRMEAIGVRGPAPPPDAVQASEREELLRLLDKGNLNSLEAVIAAYRAFLAWCETRGLHKEPTETPAEHGARVLQAFPVPRGAMDEFLRAYEVARLSGREPTPQERAKAVAFSKEIQNRDTGGGPAS